MVSPDAPNSTSNRSITQSIGGDVDKIKQRVHLRRKEMNLSKRKTQQQKESRKSSILSSLDFWDEPTMEERPVAKTVVKTVGNRSIPKRVTRPSLDASVSSTISNSASVTSAATTTTTTTTTPTTAKKRYSRRGSVTKKDDVRLQPHRQQGNSATNDDDTSVCTMVSAATMLSVSSAPVQSATKTAPPRRKPRNQRRGSMVGSMSTDMPTPGQQRKPVILEAPLTPPPPPPMCIDQAPIGSLIPSPEFRRRRPARRSDGTTSNKQNGRSSSCGAISYKKPSTVSSSAAGTCTDSKATPKASNKQPRNSLSRLSKLKSVTPSAAASSANGTRADDSTTVSTASTSTTGTADSFSTFEDGTKTVTKNDSKSTKTATKNDSKSTKTATKTTNSATKTATKRSSTTKKTKSPSTSSSVKKDEDTGLSRSAHARLQDNVRFAPKLLRSARRSNVKDKNTTKGRTKSSKSRAASCTSTTSATKKPSANRRSSITKASVDFDSVMVQEYPIMLGDNPSVTAGAPLTLGWIPITSYHLKVEMHQRMKTTKKKAKRNSITSPIKNKQPQDRLDDSSEHSSTFTTCDNRVIPLTKSTKRHRHQARKEMYLSEHVRAQILLRAGYCLADIVDAGLEVQRIQKERADSLRKQQWEIFRDVLSKAGNAFSRIWTTDSHIHTILYPTAQQQQQQQQLSALNRHDDDDDDDDSLGSERSERKMRATPTPSGFKPTSVCPRVA